MGLDRSIWREAEIANVPYSGVAEIQPETRLPDDYQHIQASPGSFGAGIAQGVEAIGQGATKAGAFYGQAAADDASNQLQEQYTRILYGDPNASPGPDGQPDLGYLGLKGRNAMEARPGVERQLDDAARALKQNLSTPESQLQFDNFSRRYRSIVAEKIGSHADQQSMQWYTEVNGKTAEVNAAHIANAPDDEKIYEASRLEIVGALMRNAQMQGAKAGDPVMTAAVQAGMQTALKTRVQAMGTTNPAGALDFLNNHRSDAGAGYEQLANELRARADQQIGTTFGTQAFSTAPRAGAPLARYPSGEVRAGTSVDAAAPRLMAKLSTDLGVTRDQAAGMVGWMAGESMLRSSSVNQGGLGGRDTGLAQWVGPRKQALFQFASARGLDPMSEDAQTQFLEQELCSPAYAGALARIRAAPTVDAANRAFGDFYEGATGVPAPRYQAHLDWAHYVSTLGTAQSLGVLAPGVPETPIVNAQTVTPISTGTATPQTSIPPTPAALTTAPPSVITGPQQQRAATFQQIDAAVANGQITPQQAQYAYVAAERASQRQAIEEGATAKARKDASDHAMDGYVKRLLTNDTAGIVDQIANDPSLTPEVKWSLGKAAEAQADEGAIGAAKKYGSGFWDGYKRILAPADDSSRISDPAQILRQAGPSGTLTMEGAEKLIQVMRASQRSVDDQAVNTAKVGFLNYAKGILSFEQDLGPLKIRDPKGEALFNAQLIPKYEAAFDKWIKDGKDPWAANGPLSQEYVDKMLKGMRPKAQMDADRMAATGEDAATAPTTAQAVPPAPTGIDANGWAAMFRNMPQTEAGAPYPAANWAQVLQVLKSDPSPKVMDYFNKHFSAAGYNAQEVLDRLNGKPEHAASQPAGAYHK